MKKLSRTICLGLTVLLGGCVSQYSITEQEMEQYLSKEIHFEVKQGNQLVGIDVRINDISVKLGQKPDTMSVSASTKVSINNPIFPLNAKLTTTFEAKPWYDSATHSIYLRQLELVKVESTPKDIERAMSSATPQVMGYLRQFLENQPVYVLDTQDSNQALMAKMAESLQVAPGKLVLKFK
ncbi:DUF1439 domain-containing protein [Shewanella glacialipiscicola]|uniref:DUF1439 domain-containing protein n=1 Tax=Shewanella glacialipiscicola TaxID=614069 RepID=A0ABQ6JBJ5_9GAMM|nr:DUF1439 domain-containing protein [Shewanella glacialipiscicola]MCL1086385.1 DUF1439 domain-containing protein [Shewanella glacialipiscicola]GIU17318.1 hypothetical protein TUM4636_31120 [Shewanella glacialipiscicola]GMA84175.1 hypothetical protein GCM10025855_37080 [Shewanella glacialipiscicola]